MLNGKKESFTGSQVNDPDLVEHFGDERSCLEFQDLLSYLCWKQKFRKPSREFYVTSHPVGKGSWWPSGRASSSVAEGSRLKPDSTEDPPCMWACCTLNHA
ncbi:hypothetical protein AVEN_194668-1 [Araneus ventricosus]|uniref:Uncharacterized protein n=1 Tax=Araneus ventricosus TaxID=182803 RepID=A0A4Y2A859_ARAVE|nr:hypothetical protein AVEN_194668-1 [Araneus ventricosus]